MTLPPIHQNEVLRYLGCCGQTLPAQDRELLREAEGTTRALAEPRVVRRTIPTTGEEMVRLLGPKTAALFADCIQLMPFAVTLGTALERELARQSRLGNMAFAVTLDACASAAVEAVCDAVQAEAAAEARRGGLYLTDRVSPGYGDFPLAAQGEICRLLDTPRAIGLTLTEDLLLIPRKSVTAVVGFAKTPQPQRGRGCAACSLHKTCAFRRKGTTCDG